MADVAALLAGVRASDDGTVAVVSTDLSHFLDLGTAWSGTRAPPRREWGYAAAIRSEDACGHWALRKCSSTPRRWGLDVELLRRGTSVDAGGGTDRVVGYGSFLVHAGCSD